jgi:peroxiredoxin Q/BCP
MMFGGLKNLWGKEYEGIHRTTFVIDENGVILSVSLLRSKTKEHTATNFRNI